MPQSTAQCKIACGGHEIPQSTSQCKIACGGHEMPQSTAGLACHSIQQGRHEMSQSTVLSRQDKILHAGTDECDLDYSVDTIFPFPPCKASF